MDHLFLIILEKIDLFKNKLTNQIFFSDIVKNKLILCILYFST